MNAATSPVDIRPDHLAIVQDILRAHLPADFKVWVFGSRATWTAKDSSDLDLAIEGPSRLDHPTMLSLKIAFEESDLPYTVDVLDFNSISDNFKQLVKEQIVPLPPVDKQESIANLWEVTTLGEISDFRSGGPFPRRLQGKIAGQYPFIKVSDMNLNANSVRILDSNNWVDDVDLPLLKSRPFPEGSTVFAKIGEGLKQNRRRYLVQPTLVDNNMMGAVPSEAVDGLYLYYALSQFDFGDLAGGTALPYLSIRDLRVLDIKLPPLAEQRAIAHVLGAMDDKIELNRRMNRTLEEMAQAIFKDWFVDFGPTRAKIEGRDPYLPPDLWSLFPNRLVNSELGEIPEGWEIATLGELIELRYGKALAARDRCEGTIPVYGSNGQVGWHNEPLVVEPGIVVGRKGTPGVVTWSHSGFFAIDTTFYVVLRNTNQHRLFFYFALIGQDLPSLAADSAVPGLNRNLAYLNLQVVPERQVMDEFAATVSNIYSRSHRLQQESRALAAARDALLPRLLSGQVCVAGFLPAGESAVGSSGSTDLDQIRLR